MATKVVLVGNAQSGKTRALRQLLGQATSPTYQPTLGVEVEVYTSPTGVTYNIWDTAGDPTYAGLDDGYYVQADVVIYFPGGRAFRTMAEWAQSVRRVTRDRHVHHTYAGDLAALLP